MDPEINIISSESTLDKDLLRRDFNSKRNEKKRAEFFNQFDEAQRTNLRTKWYDFMHSKRDHIGSFE